jgi:predicted transcriptional regulator
VVSRRKTGRLFRYSAVLPQAALRKLAVKELVDSFFGGSREALLDFLQAEPASRIAAEQELLDTALL